MIRPGDEGQCLLGVWCWTCRDYIGDWWEEAWTPRRWEIARAGQVCGKDGGDWKSRRMGRTGNKGYLSVGLML